MAGKTPPRGQPCPDWTACHRLSASPGPPGNNSTPSTTTPCGRGRDVAYLDGEVAGQADGRLAGPGQPQGAVPARAARAPRQNVAVVAADRPGRLEVAEPVEEALDVGSVKRGRDVPIIVRVRRLWPDFRRS